MSTPKWDIPDSWAWTEMGEIANVVGGGTPRTDDPLNYEAGDIPWITPADLSGYKEKLISNGARNITAHGLANSGARMLPARTVLFSSRAPIGYVAIAANPVSTNQGFKSFVLPEDISSDYAYYYLQRAKEFAIELASGTTFLEISGAKAALIPFPLAPRPEQDRIVAEIEKQFTRLDDAVAALKRVQANLKRYRASLLKAACEGRLVPTEAELARKEGRRYEPASELLKRILAERRAKWEADQLQKMIAAGKPPKDNEWKHGYNEPQPPETSGLPELPDGWEWASLDQLFRVERGRFSVRPRNDPRYFNGPYPFVQIGNLPREGGQITNYEQTLNEDGLLVSKMFNKGTVLIAIVGATIANTGILSFDCCCPDSLVGLQAEDRTLLEFTEAYLRSKKLVLRQASYSSGGQPNINLGMLLPYTVPLPPAAEQTRIIQELQRRLSAIEASESAVQKQIQHASALRRALLNGAFSGKLVSQDPNDEPASVLLERIRAERARPQEQKQKTPKAANGASPTNGQRRGHVASKESEVETPRSVTQRRRRVAKLAQGVSPGKG